MTTTAKRTVFTPISQNEVKFEYKDKKFILQEQKVGVYGQGRCVSLYELGGVKKEFVKCIGWTKSDNYDKDGGKECVLRGIVTPIECQLPALTYVKSLLD
jgi:hypothetical protein